MWCGPRRPPCRPLHPAGASSCRPRSGHRGARERSPPSSHGAAEAEPAERHSARRRSRGRPPRRRRAAAARGCGLAWPRRLVIPAARCGRCRSTARRNRVLQIARSVLSAQVAGLPRRRELARPAGAGRRPGSGGGTGRTRKRLKPGLIQRIGDVVRHALDPFQIVYRQPGIEVSYPRRCLVAVVVDDEYGPAE